MEPTLALLDVTAGFWQSTAEIGTSVPFQIVLTCLDSVDVSGLRFSSLQIGFSDERPDLIISNGDDLGVAGDGDDLVELGNVGMETVDGKMARLGWKSGGSMVFTGRLESLHEAEIQVGRAQNREASGAGLMRRSHTSSW
jgi:hypothetical protein